MVLKTSATESASKPSTSNCASPPHQAHTVDRKPPPQWWIPIQTDPPISINGMKWNNPMSTLTVTLIDTASVPTFTTPSQLAQSLKAGTPVWKTSWTSSKWNTFTPSITFARRTHVSSPQKDRNLADCLHWLVEDPEWSVVQSDKTGQWLPILVKDYIADMEVHLCRYCNEIPRSHLNRVYKDTMTLINEIDHLCPDREEQFLRSWAKTKKNLSVRISIKDHKPAG
jgi:hypothetical protein